MFLHYIFVPLIKMNMAKKKILKDETIALAKRVIARTELLINQCNNWLPEDEGIRNVEKQIMKRKKTVKKKIIFAPVF
jgi:hypothetical protein